MFRIEAREHLNVISIELTRLEKGGSRDQAGSIEIMYRETHTLKGAARSVNLVDIVALCQAVESVFSALKNGRMVLSPQAGDLLHHTIDFCFRLVDGKEAPVAAGTVVNDLIRQLHGLTAGSGSAAVAEAGKPVAGESADLPSVELERVAPLHPTPGPDVAEPPDQGAGSGPAAAGAETVRIATAALDALLLQAEEMVAVKIAATQRMTELQELQHQFDAWKKERQRDLSFTIPRTGSGTGQISTEQFIPTFGARLTALVRASEDDHRASASLIDTLLYDMKKTLMLPFSSLFEMFPRLVRDLARTEGKMAEVTIEGGEIKVDRRILQELKDPLIHMVRNCLVHGIESPAEREKKNKPVHGVVRIEVASRNGKIEIAVADDGRGIDLAGVVSAAVKQEMIAADAVAALDDREALQLLFRSGVTTSPLITDLSGRGLGLAIVREKVEKLNGTVTVHAGPEEGTTFRLVVPLSLATYRGVLVRVAEQQFVLPSSNVERVARIRWEEVETVENRETLVIDGRPLALVRLGDVLELKTAVVRQPVDEAFMQVAVVGAAEKRMAFMVDEILGEQEVLVKPLGQQLPQVRNIMGATVFGNGRVVPLLNISDLLKTAMKKAPSFMADPGETPVKSNSVLVVEDSITARMLMKNILEAAGYEVQAVVDGVEAIAALRSGEFDIVVSDVEMPRMDGFDLTAKIRADNKLASLPVVLVTALESREDRERGIDVGASAYIVKSSFDQSNLLEVIGRLI
ncbi:response regulator [Desulfoprunum benzoelyticum]|uniref:histidine kinase n=1 Tax=Desulfoprunum benzoelyticum TaxID=1506996 RepID=A0A840V2F8_9BACT|nr:response regulator [Desulfoprunum benzoelyticum]MBB5347909.1 two-component system chemotaxis sensor kinase CheA [Desulfoprunum benzoelyticum]MBM9530334.1 response regulator [Desulfoprunum benzoelyticum]